LMFSGQFGSDNVVGHCTLSYWLLFVVKGNLWVES